MILDVIIILLFIFMMFYGYKKGFIGIVAKLISLIVAFILAYFLAKTVGDYIAGTSFGNRIQTSIENNVLGELDEVEQSTVISIIKENLGLEGEQSVIKKIIDYVFMGVGFVIVFVIARIVLWVAQKILESIFDLPVLKAFNKIGGVITSAFLFIIEISIILAVIKSVSTLNFMAGAVSVVESSVITKALYDHNIVANLILNKIL